MKLPSAVKGWLNLELTPEQLLERYYTSQDSSALADLVKMYNKDLFHYLLSLSSADLAKDIIQITWLKVMKINHRPEYNNVKSWLFRIARNTLIDELRKQQLFVEVDTHKLALASYSLQEGLDKQDRLTQFNLALKQLSFYQREAIIFQQEGFSVEEIASLTNESFETIKSRLRYGKQHLKLMLGKTNEQ